MTPFEEKLKRTAKHFSNRYCAISNQVALTVHGEEERHFQAGKALALSLLAQGYSRAAIEESARYRTLFRSKLSNAEGRSIFKRAIAAAVAEWNSTSERWN